MTENVRPMPVKYGVGFVSEKPLPEDKAVGYRYEQVGMHHNYHVTTANWEWPIHYGHDGDANYIIDGFSPNLNKQLHVGHLRNLAIAVSLQRILRRYKPRMVALLGASQGVKGNSIKSFHQWNDMVGYCPEIYYDVLQPIDAIVTREPTVKEIEEKIIDVNRPDDLGYELNDMPQVWDGPKGPVLVIRSDKRPLYAFYDLVFAKEVGPTHYITGHEQKDHFASIGLEDKHLPMGLVLGEDGTKLKSRSGDAMGAAEALGTLMECIAEVAIAKKTTMEQRVAKELAWNIFAWNFLHANRETSIKFEAEKWVRTEAPGMYITYTYARLRSALRPNHPCFYNEYYSGRPTEGDAKLLGLAEQYNYYWHKAVTKMDPAPIANFAHELARALSIAYDQEAIRGGRMVFFGAVSHATMILGDCMKDLGMFCIETV